MNPFNTKGNLLRAQNRPNAAEKPTGKSRFSKPVRLVSFALVMAGFLNVANESQSGMITRIGEYYLGQDIKMARGLVEFKPDEYAVFRSSPGWFGLPGERIFKAPEVTFNRHLWYLTIGAINKRIYMLALQNISSEPATADILIKETLRFVTSQMGAPTEQTEKPKRYVWDSVDGSVILAERSAMGFTSINFILTSKRLNP